TVTVVTPLAQAAPRAVRLSTAERTQARQEAVQVRQVVTQRREQETRLAASGGPLRSGDAPRAVKLDLPKQPEIKGARPVVVPPKPDPAARPAARTGPPIEPRRETPPANVDPPPPKPEVVTPPRP